jgi:hypothetical protein
MMLGIPAFVRRRAIVRPERPAPIMRIGSDELSFDNELAMAFRLGSVGLGKDWAEFGLQSWV